MGGRGRRERQGEDEETEEEGGEDGEAGSGKGVSGEQLGVRKGRRVRRWRGGKPNVARRPRDLRVSLPRKRKLELGGRRPWPRPNRTICSAPRPGHAPC